MELSISEILFICFVALFILYNIYRKIQTDDIKETYSYELSKKEIENLKNKKILSIENESEDIFNYVEKMTFFKDLKLIVYLLNEKRSLIKNSDNDFFFTYIDDFPFVLNDEKDFIENKNNIKRFFNSKIESFAKFDNKEDSLIFLDDIMVLKIKNKFYYFKSFLKIDTEIIFYTKGEIIKDTSLKNIYNIFYSKNDRK